MTSCLEALRILEFGKKLVEIRVSRKVVDFWVYKMCCVFVEEIVSLSLLMSKNLKLKKVNKSFVPEPISCFSDSYMCYELCERFLYPYEYAYFMHVNILVVFLDLFMLHY